MFRRLHGTLALCNVLFDDALHLPRGHHRKIPSRDFSQQIQPLHLPLHGERIDYVPDTPDMAEVTPVYESWPGWMSSTAGARRWDDLPKPARAYLHRIAELAGVPIEFVSVGPERAQLLEMHLSPWLSGRLRR